MSDPRHPPTDPPPTGREWVWNGAYGWMHRYISGTPATPVPSPPMRPAGLGPFEMPVKRNLPLPADHKGVVAAGSAVANLRGRA